MSRPRTALLAVPVLLLALIAALLLRPEEGEEHSACSSSAVTPGLAEALALRSARSSPEDPRFFADGVWHFDGSCPRCALGAVVADAVLGATEHDSVHAGRALEALSRFIRARQQANGSFASSFPQQVKQPDIDTAMVTGQVALVALLLADRMDGRQRAELAASVRGGADFLIRNGNLHWYTNGNIALFNAVDMAFAQRLTGDAAYGARYREALEFALHPQGRGHAPAGAGLVVTRRGARADGSDGAGYLSESAGGAEGFDPDYGQVQLDVALRLWLLERDTESLRLVNLLYGQLAQRVDVARDRLDTSGGSRHQEPGRWIYFDSAAPVALWRLDGRDDLRRPALAVCSHLVPRFASTYQGADPNEYFALGSQAAMTVLVAHLAGTRARDRPLASASFG
ncbi:hypothetical protein EV189_2799 [Motilibacter rhizosphaerae]|uniref:Prenyltransferase/squalene oxidase-like repeat protein n=1 Tax=Motilibacter rhizosphaerae TaxID=598652 RepID=A0A4Q7NPZ6_9ACTN|nr:hypothetical protein [Motilibacter rhizosphaerae]RZS87371.1 hypothetical protein EV189_2799 [Motilibacter rhizosphaerae]